jgi:hypothetical protein
MVACVCSVAWAALAGVASVTAGTVTGSVALLAFGLDSVIDGSASAVLIWRFRLELPGAGHPVRAARTAARVVAAAMLAAAVYVAAQAARALITAAHPGQRAWQGSCCSPGPLRCCPCSDTSSCGSPRRPSAGHLLAVPGGGCICRMKDAESCRMTPASPSKSAGLTM